MPIYQFWKKKFNRNHYSPVQWRDNRAKVDKILFVLVMLYKSLHMVLVSGGSDNTDWKPGLLIFSSLVIFHHRMGFVWGRLMQGGGSRKR